jgi:PEP-CTERM motif-containing protein
MLNRRLLVGTLLMAGLVATARPASATFIQYELEELSSSVLISKKLISPVNALVPGDLIITNTAPDTWTVDFSATDVTFTPAAIGLNSAWLESGTTVDYVHQSGPTTLELQSDFPMAQLPAGLVCVINFDVACTIGRDSAGNLVTMQVLDFGDGPAVPEPTSVVLLGTGAISLIARRWRHRSRRGDTAAVAD